MTSAFTYHRVIAPMLWVLVGLSSIEMVVVHGLLAVWHSWVAIVTSVFTLAGIGWLIATIRSFRSLPVLVGPDGIEMRIGRLKVAHLTVDAVGGLREHWTAETVRQRNVLNMALVAYPNVVVDLRNPQRFGRRTIDAIAHRLDDPAGFAAAVGALGRNDD